MTSQMTSRTIQPGDRVRIIAGPFAGGEATVQAVDADKSQVRVEMLVLGQPAPFSVKLNQVDRIG
jgi:transcription antitermination factor NusG